MEARLDALSFNNCRRRRSSSRRCRSRPREGSRNSGLYYYHETFRDRARKCRSPYNWAEGTVPAVRKRGMRQRPGIPPHIRHRQEVQDLLSRGHRYRYMLIPAQQTTRVHERRHIRVVRDQLVTHRDLRHYPNVP